MGSGLGHLTRTLKVIKTRALSSPIIIFTNSQFIRTETLFLNLNGYFQEQNIKFITITPKDNQVSFLASFIQALSENKVNELYIDCFPVGIYGELNGLTKSIPHINVHLIARLIYWQNYQSLIKEDNHFESVFYVEELEDYQLNYFKQVSTTLSPLNLIPFLESKNNKGNIENTAVTVQQNYCLFVHSGTESEVEQLLDYGIQKLRFNKQKVQLVLASPWPIPEQFKDLDIHTIQNYPIKSWIMNASIIVSAAGFNLMHEVTTLKVIHWVLPFERRYDDQFSRLAKSRSNHTLSRE